MSSFSKLHAVENITSGSYMLPEFGAKGWTEVFTEDRAWVWETKSPSGVQRQNPLGYLRTLSPEAEAFCLNR